MGEGRGGVAVMGLRCGDWRETTYVDILFSSFFLPSLLFISFLFIYFLVFFFFLEGSFLFGRGRLVICVTAL